MNRRDFFATGLGGALGAVTFTQGDTPRFPVDDDEIRAAFPRLKEETYLNAAGMMPLSTFSQEGLQRYMAFQQVGSAEGRGAYVQAMQAEIRGLFGTLIEALSTVAHGALLVSRSLPCDAGHGLEERGEIGGWRAGAKKRPPPPALRSPDATPPEDRLHRGSLERAPGEIHDRLERFYALRTDRPRGVPGRRRDPAR